jgi:hypothetical protein
LLREACADDEELRREVESLLAQSSSTRALLDRTAWGAEAATADTRTILMAGARLGPYEIVALIGRGGMGNVYRALDTRLNRPVAIKISDEQFSARFEREARAISALNHPHICTLYHVGPNYLVMELMDGQTLAGHLKKDCLGLERILRWGADRRRNGRGPCARDCPPGPEADEYHYHRGGGSSCWTSAWLSRRKSRPANFRPHRRSSRTPSEA